jgi:hypothetical protein
VRARASGEPYFEWYMSRMSRIGRTVQMGMVACIVVSLTAACERNNGEATPPETPITESVPAAAQEASAAASSQKPIPTLSVAADGGVSEVSP